MRLRAEQVEAHLAKSLAPAYLVYGDEPLIVSEVSDAVRAAARARGFEERQVLFAERGFDWSEFGHATAALSLFGGRKIVELRLPGGKPGAAAAQAIERYAASPNPDTLLLASMPRPEGPNWWKSGWFTGIESAGAVVEAAPVPRAALPKWIAARLARQRQRATPEVLEFLADRVEGNLLAAQQEINKLALLAPEGALDPDVVQDAVAPVARFDPSLAAEALVRGRTARYLRIVEGLRAEGEAVVLVNTVVSGALFALARIASGTPAQAVFRAQRLWSKPLQAALESAALAGPEAIERAIERCARADRAAKGMERFDPWDELLRLGLELADGSKA